MMYEETFIYCSVLPAGFDSTYFYLSFIGELPAGTHVQVPFGSENKLVPGTVTNCETFTADEVPFPVEKMKCIIRTLSEEEFETLSKEKKAKMKIKLKSLDSFLSKTSDDLEEVDELIEDEDYDGIFKWASRHHDCVSNPDVLQKVLECYEMCVGQNMPEAALNLGTMYYNGRVVAQDFKKAAHYYKIAADAGNYVAFCNLGYCYYYGRHQDVDYEKAYEYFLKGALLYNDAICLYKIGDMYLNGYGVEKNTTYAFMLYKRAWDVCDDRANCTSDIQFRLGKCFLKGIGTPVDAETALHYLTQALCGFYSRRKTDPFVPGLIDGARELIEEAQEMLNDE
ncbi:MAG: SEL1-like repeat protein [Thermoguttaceae bacterium]|nr:SEL1-like repeat protein [Thermoguttaceae bacterium]